MKKWTLTKRIVSLALVFLISINSFAAVVSDNDGSAFITKAEFDSLKNNFQAQIDNYNTSIDSKIDGAIAQYLAGIKLTTVSQEKILIPDAAISGVRIFNNNDWLNHTPGRPNLTAYILDGYCEQQNWRMKALSKMTTNPMKGTRAMLNKINYNAKTAAWAGVGSDVEDQVVIYCDIFKDHGSWTTPAIDKVKQNYLQHFALVGTHITATTSNILTKTFPVGRIDHSGLRPSPGTLPDTREDLWNQLNNTATIFGATQSVGNLETPFIITEKSLNYMYFSDYNNPACWFCGNGDIDDYISYDLSQQVSLGYYNQAQATVPYFLNAPGPTPSGNLDYKLDMSFATLDTWKDCLFMTLGFVGDTINNWKYIYDTRFDTIASGVSDCASVIYDDSGLKHISVNAGLPLVEIKSGNSYSIGLQLQGASTEWALWISDAPFADNLESQNNIDLTSYSRHADKKNVYILNPTDTIKFTASADGIVWLKWRKNITDFDADDTSILLPEEFVTVQVAD